MRNILSLMVAFTASVAAAQSFSLSESTKRVETPRHLFVELKLSPYTTSVDKGLDSKPFAKTFGEGPMLLGEAEVDYQFFQAFGSLAAGLSVGYAEKFGPSTSVATEEKVGGSTGLRVFPLKALLVYRFDWLKERFHIPLVPYGKGAFVSMPWVIVNQGKVEVAEGVRAEGVKFGVAGVAGLSLEIDFLDPRLARDFDVSMGVNHTYIFAEATFQGMNLSPKGDHPLNLSSQHFMFGLGFEI